MGPEPAICDIDAKDGFGMAPLHYACNRDHADVVEALLSKGADVDAKTSFGDTPLYLACRCGHALSEPRERLLHGLPATITTRALGGSEARKRVQDVVGRS